MDVDADVDIISGKMFTNWRKSLWFSLHTVSVSFSFKDVNSLSICSAILCENER